MHIFPHVIRGHLFKVNYTWQFCIHDSRSFTVFFNAHPGTHGRWPYRQTPCRRWTHLSLFLPDFASNGIFFQKMIHLSFFGFLAIYGPFTGLVGVGRFPHPLFRGYVGRGFQIIGAPKEHGRSGTVIIRTIATFLRINHTSPAKWAWVVVNCKNLCWHIYMYSTISTGPEISRATFIAASSAFACVENKALCFCDDAQ